MCDKPSFRFKFSSVFCPEPVLTKRLFSIRTEKTAPLLQPFAPDIAPQLHRTALNHTAFVRTKCALHVSLELDRIRRRLERQQLAWWQREDCESHRPCFNIIVLMCLSRACLGI